MRRQRNSGSGTHAATGLVLALALLPIPLPVSAQSQRDPTLAPVSAAAPGEVRGPASAGNAMSVIVRDGRPYLVVGTRLVAQGGKLGNAVIEHIGETEIWLREAGQLRKVARFSGVQRNASAAPGSAPDCAPPAGTRQAAKAGAAGGATGGSRTCVRPKP